MARSFNDGLTKDDIAQTQGGGWQQPPPQGAHTGNGWEAPMAYANANVGAGAYAPNAYASSGSASGISNVPYGAAYGQGGIPRGGEASSSSDGGFGGGFGAPLSPRSLATAGLGMYGGKFLNDGATFVSSNYAKYLSTASMRAYFDVTESYVFHKLRLVMCPFLHKGSWARLPESVAGGTGYKPPRNDINAPDLYIPLMAFWTYVLVASIRDMFTGARGTFTPETLATTVWWSSLLWGFESAFIWVSLRSVSSANHIISAPMLDLVSYVGYTFVYAALGLMMKAMSSMMFYSFLAWCMLCNAVFIAKTLKRIVFSESRHTGYSSSTKHNYVLLLVAVMQAPIHLWLAR